MALETISPEFGHGGSGLSDNSLKRILAELQGVTLSVLAGAGSGVKMNLAAIRTQDKLVGVLELVGAGTTVTDVTDRLSATTIADCRAVGTLTLAGLVAGDTAVVRGKTYTFKAAPSIDGATIEVALGADATAAAANLAAAINLHDGALLVAESSLGVVTIHAVAEGTAGNAYTIVGGTHVTASGATLSGGTVTGGISISAATTGSKVLVLWINKS